MPRPYPCDPSGNIMFEAFQVEPADVQKNLHISPAVSSRGPDGLTPQYLLEKIACASDEKLLNTLTKFMNVRQPVRRHLGTRILRKSGHIVYLVRQVVADQLAITRSMAIWRALRGTDVLPSPH